METVSDARLRDFFVYNLPHELVFQGRDYVDHSFFRFLIIQKSSASRSSSSSTSSSSTTASSPDAQSSSGSLKSGGSYFAEILSNAIQNGANGEKVSERLNSENLINFSEFRLFAPTAMVISLLREISSGRHVVRGFGLIGCVKYEWEQ